MSASPRVAPRVRNRVGWRHRVARLGGSPVHLDLRAFDAPLEEIARLGNDVAGLSDERIAHRAADLRARAGGDLDELQAPLFALVRAAAARTVGLRHFDVQVVAALALARGRVVEMQTGEDKTLAAVMPAALHAGRAGPRESRERWLAEVAAPPGRPLSLRSSPSGARAATTRRTETAEAPDASPVECREVPSPPLTGRR